MRLWIFKMKIIKKGSCVKTKVGIGKVERIDSSTYSIPLIIIKLTKGKHKGEKVAMVKSQLEKVRKC